MTINSCSKKQLRQFGFLIGLGFPIIIGWIIPSLGGHLFRLWTLWLGIPSILIGIFKPRLLFYPYNFWMSLGLALGYVNSYIILGLVFIFVLLPIALIMRCFGYDPLREKQKNRNSYRETKKDQKIDLTRIF